MNGLSRNVWKLFGKSYVMKRLVFCGFVKLRVPIINATVEFEVNPISDLVGNTSNVRWADETKRRLNAIYIYDYMYNYIYI